MSGAPSLRTLFPAIREAMEAAGSFELTATGSSMEPFLRGGRDRVTLIPPGARPVRPGDMALFQRDSGAFVLHRVRDVAENGDMRIVGDAQLACEFVRRDQLRAVVQSCVRKGRRIDCEKGLVRAFLTARMRARTRFPRAARALSRVLRFPRRAVVFLLRGAGWIPREGASSAHS